MKDAKGHGSNPRGAHAAGVEQVGKLMYHGSPFNFSSFELAHGGPSSKVGMWLSDDPKIAQEYAKIGSRYTDQGGPYIYQANVTGRLATQQDYEKVHNAVPPIRGTKYNHEHDAAVFGKLKATGFDGVRFGDSVYLFDPKKASVVRKDKVEGSKSKSSHGFNE